MQQLGAAIAMMFKCKGNSDRAIHDSSCQRATVLPTRRIIDQIRGTVGSRRHNFAVTYLETLTDILVHGQDIAIPFDCHHDVPPAAAATAASRVWTLRWPPPFPATKS